MDGNHLALVGELGAVEMREFVALGGSVQGVLGDGEDEGIALLDDVDEVLAAPLLLAGLEVVKLGPWGRQ